MIEINYHFLIVSTRLCGKNRISHMLLFGLALRILKKFDCLRRVGNCFSWTADAVTMTFVFICLLSFSESAFCTVPATEQFAFLCIKMKRAGIILRSPTWCPVLILSHWADAKMRLSVYHALTGINIFIIFPWVRIINWSEHAFEARRGYNYSQTPLKAYRPWTDFISLKWGYP